MKLNGKDLIYIAIILVLCILYYRSGCGKPEPNTEVIKPQLVPTVQKVDKAGTPYTDIVGKLYTEAQMKYLTDSLRKVLGKGKVTGVVETITDIHETAKTDSVYVDTTTCSTYAEVNDSNYHISYTGDRYSGEFDFSLTPDTATRVTTLKKMFLRSDLLSVSEYHTNELFAPSQGIAYSARQRKVLVAIGPIGAVGYGTGSTKPQGFIGIGAVLNIISIKTK